MSVSSSRSSIKEPRHGVKDRLQSADGPDVALARGGLVDPQYLGSLVVVQLLEMPQDHHLAVERLHAVEGLLKADPHLGPDGRLRRRGHPAEELRVARPGSGQRIGLRTAIGHGSTATREYRERGRCGDRKCAEKGRRNPSLSGGVQWKLAGRFASATHHIRGTCPHATNRLL